jgi:GNAT superfamily N-acetyltransferase
MEEHKAVAQIRNIWKACFDVDDSYFNRFAEGMLPLAITFVAVKDKTCACLPEIMVFSRIEETIKKVDDVLKEDKYEIVSSLHILPVELITFGKSTKTPSDEVKSSISSVSSNENALQGGYLYGVATLPEWRNRGYATLLINSASSLMSKCGMTYFLTRPAEPDLFVYYCKLGFTENIFRIPEVLPDCEKLSEVHKQGLNAMQLFFLRQETWEKASNSIELQTGYKNELQIGQTNPSELGTHAIKNRDIGYFRWGIKVLEYIISLDDDSAPEPSDSSRPYALFKPFSEKIKLPAATIFSFPME